MVLDCDVQADQIHLSKFGQQTHDRLLAQMHCDVLHVELFLQHNLCSASALPSAHLDDQNPIVPACYSQMHHPRFVTGASEGESPVMRGDLVTGDKPKVFISSDCNSVVILWGLTKNTVADLGLPVSGLSMSIAARRFGFCLPGCGYLVREA